MLCCEECPDHPDTYIGDGYECSGACPVPNGAAVCRVCGCTDEYGCDGGCSWVEENLCSACQGKEDVNSPK